LEFLLRDGFDSPVIVEYDGAGTGGPLVQGKNKRHGEASDGIGEQEKMIVTWSERSNNVPMSCDLRFFLGTLACNGASITLTWRGEGPWTIASVVRGLLFSSELRHAATLLRAMASGPGLRIPGEPTQFCNRSSAPR